MICVHVCQQYVYRVTYLCAYNKIYFITMNRFNNMFWGKLLVTAVPKD